MSAIRPSQGQSGGASRVHFRFIPNAWLRSLGSLDGSTPHFEFLVRMEHRVAISDQGNESRSEALEKI
jgi:hypothetical protein